MTAEELSGNDDYVELSFSARKLDDKVCALRFQKCLKSAIYVLIFGDMSVCTVRQVCVSVCGLSAEGFGDEAIHTQYT